MAVTARQLAPKLQISVAEILETCEKLNIPVIEQGSQQVINSIDWDGRQVDPEAFFRSVFDMAAHNEISFMQAVDQLVASRKQTETSTGGILEEVAADYAGFLDEFSLETVMKGSSYLTERIALYTSLPKAQLENLYQQRNGVSKPAQKKSFKDFLSTGEKVESLNQLIGQPAQQLQLTATTTSSKTSNNNSFNVSMPPQGERSENSENTQNIE